MSAGVGLTREQVAAGYRQLLGREPGDAEVDAQLAAAHDLEGLLGVIVASEEYAERLRRAGNSIARDPTVVNVYHPDLAAYGLAPGTRSEDGVAIVGHEGTLFLCGGTNANLGQYIGEVEMAAGWLEEWRDVLAGRVREAEAIGIPTALMVVPDKLAVQEDRYPEPLAKIGPRPIERLLAEPDLDIVYPIEELRAGTGDEDPYLPTDTHLTLRGNELLFATVAPALGVEELPDLDSLPLRSYAINGDLGEKFDPKLVSIVTEPGSLGRAHIIADNHSEIAAVGGNIGTRRVFRSDDAPDPRTAVIFGDSYGNGVAHYQGISWFMAQVFREVHFVWVPFGWDPDYVREVGAEAVLIQGAERFVARVPRLTVNVSDLAQETLRRKRPVGVESVLEETSVT